MQLEHEFIVPVPIAQAWDVLLDVERIAPCMPGATVESFDGENVEGRVKVKVGPIQVTYAGTARFIDKDEVDRKVTIDARGKEARGSGTAVATIHTQLHDDGGTSTRVTVTTDLAVTGKPAQFGRGVMVEVGNKLLGRFADCLHQEIGGEGHAEVAADTAVTGEADAGAAPAADSAADARSAAAEETGEQTGTAAATEPGGDAAPDGAAAGAEPQARPAPAPGPTATPRPATPRARENEAIDLLDAAGPAVLKRLLPLLAGIVVLILLWRHARRARRR